MIVAGSDSSQQFYENCRQSCKKKCLSGERKNADRRISIYRNYVNKHYGMLIKEYQLFGVSIIADNQIIIEEYLKGWNYSSVLLRKKD